MAFQKIKRVEDESLWAKDTVQRLHALKASFLDKSEEETNIYLEEELEFLLADVGAQSGALRQKLLCGLDSETSEFSFLFFEELNGVPVDCDVAMVGDDIVSQMEGLWAKASLGERDSITERLGLVPTIQHQIDQQLLQKIELFENDFSLPETKPEWLEFDQVSEKFRESLKIKELGKVNVVELLDLFAESVGALSDLKVVLMNVWDSQVSKDDKASASLARTGPLEVQCVKKLEGDGSNLAIAEIELTKKLILALVFALSKGASEFGIQYNYKYAPENIKNAVLIENKVSAADKVRNVESKYWLKYASLAKNITAESVDEEFQKIFGKMIANWMKNR